MIDEGIFKNWWADLCERFRMTGDAEPSQRQMNKYYKYLSARIDTAEFEHAAETLWANHGDWNTETAFPKPGDFVDAAAGDREARAVDAWETVLQLASNWRRAKQENLPSERLDEAGQRALRQVGGVKKLALMDRKDLDFRRKDFLAAYQTTATANERDALPPMTADGEKLVEDAIAGRLEA